MEQKLNNVQNADCNNVSKPIAKPHVVRSSDSENEYSFQIDVVQRKGYPEKIKSSVNPKEVWLYRFVYEENDDYQVIKYNLTTKDLVELVEKEVQNGNKSITHRKSNIQWRT